MVTFSVSRLMTGITRLISDQQENRFFIFDMVLSVKRPCPAKLDGVFYFISSFTYFSLFLNGGYFMGTSSQVAVRIMPLGCVNVSKLYRP